MLKRLLLAAALLAPLAALAQSPGVPGYFAPGANGNSGVFLPVSAFKFLNITGQSTSVVKSGVGVLHAITLNNPTATAVITLYDNVAASGTKIGTITVPASPQPVTLNYDVIFANGLTVQTATASSDLTVVFQ